jgi:predicted deacylase
MHEEIIVGTARAAGPGISKGLLKTAEAPDGTSIDVPVVIVRGQEDGPVLWLHGCVHGNEYCGMYIIHEFLRGLDPARLKGAVVALPVLNVAGFRHKQRMSPYEGYNGGDLNRQFPGAGDGMGTVTQHIAKAVFEPLLRYANVLIDFHTALTPDVRWALFPKLEGEVGRTSEAVARAFGFRDTLPAPATMLAGSAMMEAARNGIAAFLAEVGGKNRSFSDATVADAARRLENVLRALGMSEGRVVDHGQMNYFSTFEWVTATHGGFFRKAVSCGDAIEAGTVLGQYYDAWGKPGAQAISPKPGIVLAIHPGPVMATGETLVHIGLDPRQV